MIDTIRAAWFVDGAYLYKVWESLRRSDNVDYVKLRQLLERRYLDISRGDRIDEAYYFNSDNDPPTAKQNRFHMALQYPPPGGPGLRVKLYWIERKKLFWPRHMGAGQVLHPESKEPFEQTQQKGVDVGLATHLMRSFAKRSWTKLFFCAGDGDFHEPIQQLVENENVELVLVGANGTMSTELLPYARDYVRIDEIADEIARPKAA
jgi:uncharacterized LabA/DUF88 family protein